MKNQSYLNQYFGNEWNGNLEQYTFTGPSLANKIADDEWVLDVGCGNNYFKGKIKNLVGIDPANDKADFKVSIEDFVTTQRFDVAFCLGSINFGNLVDITKQIIQVEALLNPKSRIYWRCNPGRQDHKTDGCKQITFFPWTEKTLNSFAKEMGYTQVDCQWDVNHRIYAEWARG